jgi:hypothetical protein
MKVGADCKNRLVPPPACNVKLHEESGLKRSVHVEEGEESVDGQERKESRNTRLTSKPSSPRIPTVVAGVPAPAALDDSGPAHRTIRLASWLLLEPVLLDQPVEAGT